MAQSEVEDLLKAANDASAQVRALWLAYIALGGASAPAFRSVRTASARASLSQFGPGHLLKPGIGQGVGALTSFKVSALCMALMPGRRRMVFIANSA